MANIIIGGIVLILVILAIRNIIKNKGTCNCGSDCKSCAGDCHCHDKK